MVEAAKPAFDAIAGGYDSSFSGTTAGHWLRESVWQRLRRYLRPGMEVLDLGCGTGEDALWLALNGCRVTAADNSPAMLAIATDKASNALAEGRVSTLALDLNGDEESGPQWHHRFDMILSNFGALNCVDDLAALGRKMQTWIAPGGVIALVFMGRFCAWESVYYLLHADITGLRRWRGMAQARIGGREFAIRYWSVGDVKRALGPSYRVAAVGGSGVLLPPSYLFRLVDRRPQLFASLARHERWVSRLWPLSRIADHVLVILMPRNDPSSGDQQ